jgi:hypothetical protein
MTKLLRQAIEEIEKLPSDEQDALAARILTDLKDEQGWTERFEATTNAQWEQLAQSARREIMAGDFASLDDVFPPQGSR